MIQIQNAEFRFTFYYLSVRYSDDRHTDLVFGFKGPQNECLAKPLKKFDSKTILFLYK